MTTTTKTAVAALTLAIASFASQAQAHTVIRYLPKSAVPFTVPHEEPRAATAAQVRVVRYGNHVHVRKVGNTKFIR